MNSVNFDVQTANTHAKPDLVFFGSISSSCTRPLRSVVTISQMRMSCARYNPKTTSALRRIQAFQRPSKGVDWLEENIWKPDGNARFLHKWIGLIEGIGWAMGPPHHQIANIHSKGSAIPIILRDVPFAFPYDEKGLLNPACAHHLKKIMRNHLWVAAIRPIFGEVPQVIPPCCMAAGKCGCHGRRRE